MITDPAHAIITPMKFRLVLVLVVVLALGAGFWFGQVQRANDHVPPDTGAIVLSAPRDPGAFELVSHTGAPFRPADLQGRWTLWFFGFTHCPDVCPMTLTALNQTDQLLAEAGAARPDILMVSVDPARDTPELLAAYVPFFNPAFTGVTGDAGQIRILTERLGIIVQYVAMAGDDYTVDHGTSMMLVGPDGMVHAVLPSPHDPQTLARDIAVLIPWLEKNS